MDYRCGTAGRIFTIRFDHGDDFLSELTQLANKENIQAAWFNLIGGVRNADVVIGPKEPTMPPEPVWETIDGAREVVGIGSIFRDENNEPKIHLHTSLGNHGETMTACVRKGTKTYLILEAYLTEIKDINASRPWYPEGQFNRLTFEAT